MRNFSALVQHRGRQNHTIKKPIFQNSLGCLLALIHSSKLDVVFYSPVVVGRTLIDTYLFLIVPSTIAKSGDDWHLLSNGPRYSLFPVASV
jgi:hypothetical protein